MMVTTSSPRGTEEGFPGKNRSDVDHDQDVVFANMIFVVMASDPVPSDGGLNSAARPTNASPSQLDRSHPVRACAKPR
jgi:hypothetical protein